MTDSRLVELREEIARIIYAEPFRKTASGKRAYPLEWREPFLAKADLILALSAGSGEWVVPPGYALVPVEPTEAMLDAYVEAADGSDGPAACHLQPAAYRAMIAAAPPIPEGGA